MSADRFRQTAKANDSGSWNEYSYTRGDPVNRVDHRGTDDFCDDDPESCDPPCEGNAFADSCGDQPPAGGGPPSRSGTSPQQPPQCDIKVEHLAIPQTGKVFVHSYLDITEANGTNLVLEGVGEPLVGGFLNPYKSADGVLKGENRAANKVDFDAQKNTQLSTDQICDDVTAILAAFANFPSNTVPYSLGGKSAPNSNSFVHYLLSFAPDLGNVGHSSLAVGWSTPILLP